MTLYTEKSLEPIPTVNTYYESSFGVDDNNITTGLIECGSNT